MKKKIVVAIISIALSASPAFAGKRTKFYDENSHYVGFIENGKVYDAGSRYKGHIEKSGKYYDEKSHYKGHIEKTKGQKKTQRHYEESDD